MTATTAAAPRPYSLSFHRYSDSVISTPRSRESSHAQSFTSSASTSYMRARAAHSMTYSTPSPPAYNAQTLASISPYRRASLGDVPLDPSSTSSAGVKYACASCIRGHRTSSCTHKDGSKGPLYPIRSKGRPPTQCEICRKKRKESGRHVRCDCTGKKTSSSSSTATTTTTTTIAPAPTSYSQKKAAAVKTNVPILPKIGNNATILEGIEASDDPRPSKRSKTQDASSPPQPVSTPLARTISDQQPSGRAQPRPSAFDNVLAPIRTQRAPNSNSWSLPSIYPAHDASRIQTLSQSNDEESTPRRHSTLSLSSLMNPCGCRSTGSCTCCFDQRQRHAPVSPRQLSRPSQDCDPARCSCSGDSCRNQKLPAAIDTITTANVASSNVADASSSCSGNNLSSSAAPSIELLLKAVDMSTEFVPPPCGCGDNCRCARCLAKQNGTALKTETAQKHAASNRGSSTVTSSSVSPRTPPAGLVVPPASRPVSPGTGCDDCAACDLALERPSGIGAVDSWMEKQRDLQRPLDSRLRSPSSEGGAYSAVTSRRSSQAELHSLPSQRGASPISAPVPTMHGGLLTSVPASSKDADAEVRAELVLVHPKCVACLEVVRSKGVGVLSSAPVSAE